MKSLYAKNQLTFSLICIGIYVFAFSLADSLSAMIGTQKLITAPVGVAMTCIGLIWLKQNGLLKLYGLKKLSIPYGRYLYFLPLVLMASTNLWGGISMHYTVTESVLYVISMICVGILEELIFRGFLFKALCKDNVKRAVIISSLTFGIGHVVNLLNGADLLPTMLQIVYATAAGFLFTVIFMRSGSLMPCIITHSIINSLSVFSGTLTPAFELCSAVFLTVVAVVYGLWILKKTEKLPGT